MVHIRQQTLLLPPKLNEESERKNTSDFRESLSRCPRGKQFVAIINSRKGYNRDSDAFNEISLFGCLVS